MSGLLQRNKLRFMEWELNVLERVLLVRGQPTPIGSRAFDVLVALANRHGQVVSKGQLLDAAWPGLVVEENNVSVQIATLRKILGAHAIATVASLGYRLTAAKADDSPPDAAPAASATGSRVHVVRQVVPIKLVGRDTAVKELVQVAASAQLVSIVGTGGVGKTSLAKAILAQQGDTAPEDVYWVDLGPLREPAQVIPLVAKTLGVELDNTSLAQSDLVAAMSQIRALIVIDNCEHLIERVAELIQCALESASGVHWLVTSQAPLRVAGEMVYRVEPLEVPPPHVSPTRALQYGSIALLQQRAAAANHHFDLRSEDMSAAIDICRKLDGLPLAIEMVASRIATLGLAEVHRQLANCLQLLSGPRGGPARHHTLRSTFDWSYGLLSLVDQKVFRRLEPFVGGFTLQMALRLVHRIGDEDHALDEPQTMESLSALVDKSLVHHCADPSHRFTLLDSAREYARQRLDEAGESEAARRKHAHVVAGWFTNAQTDLERMRDGEWAQIYLNERHNVRSALAWASQSGDPDLVARLVAALGQIDCFGQLQAEIAQTSIPLELLCSAEPALRAAACVELSWAHYVDGSRETGTQLAQQALNDFRSTGNLAGEFRALALLVRLFESRPGMRDKAHEAWELMRQIEDRQLPLRTRLTCIVAAGFQYERSRTIGRLREIETIAERAGFDALAAVCRVQITDELLIERHFEEAVEAAQHFVDDGNLRPRVRALILCNQALALVQLGRCQAAYAPARAALRALPSLAYLAADIFALAAAREGRHVDAALISGFGSEVRHERDEEPDPAEAAVINETTARLEQAMSAEKLRELRRIGATMSINDAMAIAIPT
ncbi:winged helix-turn-helix domain-containing protein [Aquincola sp. S2]|uniref:Winged helix-turn-helix domain-containing protein n=1 Tax=Pseudaquabacterium terrae TaxID=2732868 RepID=A0ABX2ES15_9BURK|nr:winged helix-turn-helix domain-containing protein [Aquabacterium terrae]NRF71535.1 winged helix-turn-helix domain-containing protein [Aquabacterium terrae]